MPSEYAPSKFLLNQLKYGIILILLLMPIQTVIVTWLRSEIPVLGVLLIWKELLLGFLCISAALLVLRDESLRDKLRNSPIERLIVLYSALHLVVWMAVRDELNARVAGVTYNLRFLVLFILIRILVYYYKPDYKFLLKLLLIPALGVVFFGALQATVLPHDILTHLGYSEETITPFQPLNQVRTDIVRINSTLSGPNPLGAYLLVPLSIVGAILAVRKRASEIDPRLLYGVALLGAVTLYATHSRSAWIGLVISASVIAWTRWGVGLLRSWLTWVIIGLVVVAGITLGMFGNSTIRNVLFHTDPNNTSQSSNAMHLDSAKQGLGHIVDHPLGEGPGAAGPTSRRLKKIAPTISENYYLQIGQEVGIVGMVLFIGIVFLVGTSLWMQRDLLLALGLFASLVGISIVGMLLHVWADEHVAYIWWGFAGFTLPLVRKRT